LTFIYFLTYVSNIGGFFALLLSFDSRKRQFKGESIMVLDGAMEHEELTLMPVDGFDAACELDGDPMPIFIFGDDDELDDEDDFEEEEEDYEDEEELEDDDDDDDEDDYEDDDYEDEDEDWEEEEE
jgi:hypothetical protein